jgi:hypothetical protein
MAMERLLLLWDEMDDWTSMCRHALSRYWNRIIRARLKITR